MADSENTSAKTELATRAEAVKALGLPSPRALDRLIERGAPGPAPGKKGGRRYNVAAIQKWRTAREARKAPMLDLTTERAKLARVQRKLTSIRLQEARGVLVNASRVADAQRAIYAAAKSELLAVSHRAVLAGMPAEYEPLIKRLIRDALKELSEIPTLQALTKRYAPAVEQDAV